MAEWKQVARSSDVTEDNPFVVELAEDESVLLSRVGGSLTACGNSCPHYAGPLGDGVMRNGTVICPYHNSAFDLRRGTLIRTPSIDGLPVYDVKEEGGSVYVGERRDPEIAMPGGHDERIVLIVGAGAAGGACAETLRREGFAGAITMITREDEGPYDRPMLSKGLLSGDSPDKYLPLRPGAFYESLGITLVTGATVARVIPERKEIETIDGTLFTGDMILLATGGVPRSLPIPGADLDGVFTLRSHHDAQRIIEACGHAGSVAILGASFIGMEVAAQLRMRDLEVTVIEPRQHPMEQSLGPEIGEWLRTIHEDQGVQFRLGRTPREIIGDRSVRRVRIDDGSEVAADIVVMGVGVEPRVDYLAKTSLIDGDPSGGVRVDNRLQTSTQGVFAAGDIAVYPAGEFECRVEHWVHAQEQGRHVAHAMLGEQSPYDRVPFFWTRQYKTTVKYAGYPREYDRIEYDGVPGKGEFVAAYFMGDSMIGVACKGKGERFVELSELLGSYATVDRRQAGF